MTLLLLVGVLFGATNTQFGRNQVRTFAEDQINAMLQGAQLEIGELNGNLLGGLDARDIRLIATSGTEYLVVDRLRARYRLWPLLRSEVVLEAVHVDGLRARASQQADSTWDWAGLLAPSEEESTWTVRIDSVSTRHVEAAAAFRTASSDSVLLVHDLDLDLSGILMRPESDVRVRQAVLRSAFQPPVRPDTVQLMLSARYGRGIIHVDTLGLRSDRSRVAAGGVLDMASLPSLAFTRSPSVGPAARDRDATLSDSTTFTLRAAPLSLSDMAPFLPMLNPTTDVQAVVDMTQAPSVTSFRGDISHSGGGRLMASMEWKQEASGSRVAATADIRGFDVDRIVGDGLETSPATATLEAALQGPSADSLSGSATLRTEAMVVNDVRVGALRFDLAAIEGRADASLQARVRQSAVQARVSGRLLDPEPAMDFEGRIEGFNLAAWTGSTDLSSRITAAFAGSARGFDPETMTSDLSVDIEPSRFGATESITAGLDVSMSDGRANWTLLSRIGQGTVNSDGEIDLGDIPVLRRSTTRMDAVDVAALLEDHPLEPVPTRVSASLTAEASLEDWRSGRGSVQLETDSTQWGTFRMARTSTEATWASGRGSVRLAALPADTSSVVMALDVRARGQRTRIESRELAWRRLDVSSMSTLDILDASLDGQGALTAEFNGADLQRVDLSLSSRPSTWGIQEIEALTLSIEADTQTMEVEADGAFRAVSGNPASSWALQASLDEWLSASPALLAELTFDALDPMAFVGLSDAGTTLSGRARGTAALADALPQTGAFELDLAPSSLRGEPVPRARVTGSLRDSVVTANAAFTVAEGQFDADLTARPFDAVPSFSGNGSVSRLNVLPLLGRPELDSDVNLTWEASGSSFDPSSTDWRVDVVGQPSRLDSLIVEDLSLAASWDGRVLDIGDLSSQFSSGNLQVNGQLNLSPSSSDVYSDLRATWYIGNLHAMERLVGLDRLSCPTGTVDLQVYGPPGQLDAEMLISLSDLEIDDQRFSSIEASAWITLDDEFLPVSTTANVDIGYVALPTLAIRTSSLQVDQRGEIFNVSARSMVDTGNKLSFSGLINPFAERPWATVQQLDILLGGTAFALDRPASLIVHEGWQINRLALTAGEQSLALAGGFSDSAGFAARIDMAAIDMAPIGALAGFVDLEGSVGGRLLLSGPADAPLIDSQLDVELLDGGEELAILHSNLQSTPEGLRVDATVAMQESEDITVQGFLPVFASLEDDGEERADRSADLNLTLQTEGGSIRWINPLLDPTVIADLEGVATMDIKVGGTIDDPQLSGFLNLDGARFRLPEYGVTYRVDRFRSTLEGVSLTFEEARIRSGDGWMDVAGQIDFASLTNSSFDLEAQLDRFRAVRNKELQTTLSGDLQLTGRTTRPDLAGRLTTSNTSFWLTDTAGGDLRQVPLSFDDQVELAENFGYRAVAADTLADAIWKGLSMDLAVEIERDTWIRQRVNPEMAIELSGRVDLQKDRGQEDLNIYRSIEVVPDRSTIKQFGRNFRIAEGVAQFNGPIEEMVLQVEAEYEVPSRLNPGQPEVVITLRLDGRLDDLAFNLSSDPAMENTDIVSYIATGRPASESLQFSDSNVNNQVLVGVAASQLAGLVEGVASQSLGLDVVSIEQDGLKGTRLTAGKYITPRLFVGVTQPFSFSGGSSIVVDEQRELTVEYEVLSYLLLQLLADASDSPVRINLAGRYSY